MDDRCPKCDAVKVGESCPKCGLVFAKFDAAVLDEGAPREIKSLWERTLDNWENESLHAIFIEKALNAGAGGYAAFCYRRRGEEDRIAKEQLEKIAKRLEQMMSVKSSASTGRRPPGRFIGILILLFVLLALAFFLLMFYSPGPM
jgi:hypothetical protein